MTPLWRTFQGRMVPGTYVTMSYWFSAIAPQDNYPVWNGQTMLRRYAVLTLGREGSE